MNTRGEFTSKELYIITDGQYSSIKELDDNSDQLKSFHVYSFIAPKFINRRGGYTRVTKLGFRDNDSASVSLLEFVDFVALDSNSAEDSKSSSKKTKHKKESEASANQE